MAEKCFTSFTTETVSTNSTSATNTFINSGEFKIRQSKSKHNLHKINNSETTAKPIVIEDSLSISDTNNKNGLENSINKTSREILTSTSFDNIKEPKCISATLKEDENIQIGNDIDEIESVTKQKLSLHDKRKDQRDHEKVGVYLETPVIDENNVSLGLHDFENVVKPKRLSDDFFSSDDGEDDEHDESEAHESVGGSQINTVHCNHNDDDNNIDDNSTEPFIPESGHVFLTDDTSSSCSNILIHGTEESHLIKPIQEVVNKNSVRAVITSSTSEKITNEFSCRATSSSNVPLTFCENDVQSMDAIERKDFEHEQRLTGGIIIKSNSLVNSDNKLNLEYLQSFKSGNKKPSSENKCSTSKMDSTSSTPTSSRCCTVRLTKSAAKLNLSSTLDRVCSTKPSLGIKKHNLNKDLENSSCNNNDNDLNESSTSSSIAQCLRIGKHLDMFLNSNSNDSLSSDKSYNTSSNHSLPNFYNKRNNVDDTPYRTIETLNNGTLSSSSSSSSISRKSDIHENNSDNNVTNNVNTYSDPIASTSSLSQRCQYTSFCCENKERTIIKKEPISSGAEFRHNYHKNGTITTLGDSKKIPTSTITSANSKQMCIFSTGSEQYPSSSSSSGSSHSSRTESRNFENPIIVESTQIPMPTEQTEIETEFDDETWADCEDDSDEEICTCYKYSNEYPNSCIEDELPSRDVDLSGYIQLVSISEDVLLQENLSTEIPPLQRKRKLNESRLTDLENSFNETQSGGGRKRLALSPRTITISSPSTSYERRVSRSLIPTKDNPPPELQDWLIQFQRWSHAERLLAVDRLIEHCEPTQVRHMMKVIEPQFQRDFISLLPRELALQVLSYLEPKDLLRAAQTCRSWRFLCDDNLLWKEKCKQAQIMTEPKTDRPKRGRAGNMPPISSPWKAAYMRQHIIEMNWRSRPIRQPKVLKGHDDHVITCLQFCGNRIVSGSDDNTLKVWSAISGKCLRTLVGHTGGVWSSQMSGNIIISGSTDRTLKVWDMESGQCIHTLLGHTSTVRCMHLHGNKVVSGSRDATLRVWDIEQGSCLHVLVGHLAAVRCVQYDGKLIVSGAYDYMVKVWNPERQECLHTLQGHTNRVYSLQFDGIHVVSGSLDTSIRVWDAETGSCKHTLMGHQSLTSGMELRQNILVSGNADSTVKVWDITTGQCLQTLSGPNKHQSAVTCLQFNSRFVITSSDDGTVKLWDVKTGEFIRNLVALDSGGSGGVVWRIRANDTKLICAVGSRNGTEETKLMVLDFDVEGACSKCS